MQLVTNFQKHGFYFYFIIYVYISVSWMFLTCSQWRANFRLSFLKEMHWGFQISFVAWLPKNLSKSRKNIKIYIFIVQTCVARIMVLLFSTAQFSTDFSRSFISKVIPQAKIFLRVEWIESIDKNPYVTLTWRINSS